MRALAFFRSIVAFLFPSILFLAGCGGVSSVSSSGPSAPPTGGNSAHATFIYVQNSSDSGGSISGFRLNSDGSLAALQGSPFAINGNLAVSGDFLLVSTTESVTSYRIDPSSGSLTRAQMATAAGSGALTANPIAADSKNVYVGGELASGTNVIYAFSIDGNGSFAAISGSPFLFSNCACLPANSIAVQNSMLFATGDGFPSGNNGALTVYKIQGGALTFTQAAGTDGVWDLAVPPSGAVVYAVNGNRIEGFTFGSDGMLTRSLVTADVGFQAVAVDPTGKFLAAADAASRITVFSIDPMSGSLTELGAPVSVADQGQNSITFDPSGRFVLITHGSITPASNSVIVLGFDPATGAVTKIQSAATAGIPESIVAAAL